MIKKNTVIFDMDGLMIDSERLTYQAYAEVLRSLGLDIDMPFYQSLLGNNQAVVGKQFLKKYGADFPFGRVVGRVHEWVNESFERDGVPLKPGLLPLLELLSERGCQAGVATSSDRVRVDRILEIAGIAKFFDFVVCGDEVANSKPDPEIFLRCCAAARCAARDAIVLEDSEAGIQAAHAARIDCIVVPDMKRPDDRFAGMAYRVVDSLAGVMALMSGGGDFELTGRK